MPRHGDPLLVDPPGQPRHLPHQPTRATVLDRLRSCAIAHFACHGDRFPEDPSGSKLVLHDHATEPLTVADLMRVRLDHVRLAYLSACRTAYQGRQLLDDSVHLASAFQLAGLPHVIAALWEISDSVSSSVAGDLYECLAKGRTDGVPDTDRAAYALHYVIRKLRQKHFDMPST
ncbi:CHAT domain-containing protein [Streptomyces albidoflavus]